MTAFIKNSLLVFFVTVVSLVGLEVTFRLWEGRPVFAIPNYRALNGQSLHTNAYAEHDPDVGWRLKSRMSTPVMSTLDYGIRKNFDEDHIRTGAILAVGDSFTAGSEVRDSESWPAFLERISGTPVVNAGAGGFGIDQSVMRAEQLLSVVHPSVLLVGMLQGDIARASYSKYGAPKPYYTIEKDELVLHNSPVPLTESSTVSKSLLKRFLGYSLAADRLMAHFDAESWYGAEYVRIQNDAVDVTCRLLQRLKQRTDALGIRTLLVVQYGSPIIMQLDKPPGDAQGVSECCRAMGFQIVDEFSDLKAVFEANLPEFKTFYVAHGESLGHMSALGNQRIAGLIAKALAAPPVPGTNNSYAPSPFVAGDGINLWAVANRTGDLVAGVPFVKLSEISGSKPGRRIYRIEPTGGQSEHYVSLRPVTSAAGPYTFSLEVSGSQRFRLQLLDDEQNGAIADIDLDAGTAFAIGLGRASSLNAAVQAEGNWYRVWVTARLPAKNPLAIIQLADSAGVTSFSPDGQALTVRAIQLERGQTATPFQDLGSLQ